MNKNNRIKNYTTSIPWSRTISEIEEMLTQIGASTIMKDYRGDGRVEALSFKLKGKGYRLPSNTEKCIAKLKEAGLYNAKSDIDKEKQAENVTWRIIKDWLDAQIALMQIGQAEPEEIMLPYMYNGKKTLYQMFKEKGFALPYGEE